MTELLKSSLIWRLCAAFAAWLSKTPVARAMNCVERAFRGSLVYHLFMRCFTGPVAAERSRYRQWLDRFNAALSRVGRSIRPAIRESVVCRALRRVYAALKQSFFLGGLFRGGVTSVLLCAIAAYYPIDWLLRSVLKLTTLAAVWDEVLLFACLIWIFVRRVQAETPLRSAASSMDVSILLYILAGMVLLLYTFTDFGVNFTGFRASMQYLLLFFVVTRLIRDERDFMKLYHIMIAIAFIFALHGILQYVIGVEIPTTWTDQAESAVRTRVYSVFKNPNILGGYMLLFAPMAIGAAYASEDALTKVFFWFCGICMCLACLFTMSRGAWVALALAALLFSLIVDRRLLVLILCGVVAACFLPFVRSRIGYLFTAEFAASNSRGGRGKRWSTALGYLEEYDRWDIGLGYGIFGGAAAMQNQINPALNYMYVDNYYVKILAENGIIGLCALISMLLGLFWNGLRACARTAGTKYKPLCAGMFAGMVGMLAQSFLESLWEEPYMMALFFAVAGMLVYAGFLRQRENEA